MYEIGLPWVWHLPGVLPHGRTSCFQEAVELAGERCGREGGHHWCWVVGEFGTVGALNDLLNLQTACLGLISGTKIELRAKPCNEHSKWVIVLGAAGAVGQFGVQVAKLCGFRVLASCSPSNDELVKSIGADATFDYKISLADQLKKIKLVTGGTFSKVFDSSAMATENGLAVLSVSTDTEPKIFATTNDWSVLFFETPVAELSC